MDSFVAIDFETAAWGAACAVGVVHFEDGTRIDQRYTLIDPKIAPQRWDRGAIRIHGIRPTDVAGAPSFSDIWPELLHYAACYPLVAHNAGFDIGVLRSELDRANLPAPTIRYGCSMQLARAAWPRRGEGSPENHKLSTLSEYLGIELDHHNALSDAAASGEIAMRAVDRLGEETLAAAYARPRLSWGELVPGSAAAS
jgi:DNA polymerase-3 subunit epsilon